MFKHALCIDRKLGSHQFSRSGEWLNMEFYHAFFGQQLIFQVVIAAHFAEVTCLTIGTNLCHCPLILGSSLPCSDDWQSFIQGHWQDLFALP